MAQLTEHEKKTRRILVYGSGMFLACVAAPFATGMAESYYRKQGVNLEGMADEALRYGTTVLNTGIGAVAGGVAMSGPRGPMGVSEYSKTSRARSIVVGGAVGGVVGLGVAYVSRLLGQAAGMASF